MKAKDRAEIFASENYTYEVCPFCETEVKLLVPVIKKRQECPNCKAMILPCTLCMDSTQVCGDCGENKDVKRPIHILQKLTSSEILKDSEQVIDFLILTKEEFLTSYSYIKEDEYNCSILEFQKILGKGE